MVSTLFWLEMCDSSALSPCCSFTLAYNPACLGEAIENVSYLPEVSFYQLFLSLRQITLIYYAECAQERLMDTKRQTSAQKVGLSMCLRIIPTRLNKRNGTQNFMSSR